MAIGGIMFILVSHGGEYDEAWECNLAASRDKSKLEARIVELTAENQARVAWKDKLRVFFTEFVNANPKRESTVVRYAKKAWPSGIGQHQITPEMRAEREAWENNESAFIQEMSTINQEWLNQQWYPAYQNFQRENNREVTPIEKMNYSVSTGGGFDQRDDAEYRIEEVEEL
jgi:hypothetical protein